MTFLLNYAIIISDEYCFKFIKGKGIYVFMKKLFYLIGAIVSAAAVFATIAILLKKLRISLSIEGLCDDEDGFDDDANPDNITVSVDVSANEDQDIIEDDDLADFEIEITSSDDSSDTETE